MARTLDELAALAGVSRATVSRSINGGSVSEATRRRVMAVMEATNYRPNVAAQALASGRSGIVGISMHLSADLLFRDPYFSQLLQGMSSVLSQSAAGMMLWLGDRSKEETLDRILRTGLLDGVIVTANDLVDPLVDGLLSSDLATVLIGHRRADRTASYVDVDNVQAADTITSHLINTGRKRIGHITGTRGSAAGEDRIMGYEKAMTRAGLSTEGLILEGDLDEPSGALAAGALLDRGVDAIFSANDASAAGALETIRLRGLRVPDDIALAGFDDLDFAATLDPPLTTIRQRVKEQGIEAARSLLRLLEDPESGPHRVILPTELIVRASTVETATAAQKISGREKTSPP